MAYRTLTLFAVVALVGCGGKTPTPAVDGGFIAGFDPPAPVPGYTRFVTPTITGITPGEDQLWCQWLAPPAAEDQDVADVTGLQSKYGHHVVLYATSEQEPVGTSRVCTGEDMETVRFLGGIGAEGSAGIFQKFPPNTVLRLNKGWGLMANTHFINAGTTTIEGQAVMDVDFVPPSTSNTVAGFFNNVNDEFTIPANTTYSLDVDCPVQQQLNFFMVADHMHALGTSMYTEAIRAGDAGPPQIMAQDLTWSDELEFNPNWVVFPADQLFQVNPGDTVHTRCTWNNTTSDPVTFPGEMCVGLGFFLPVDGGSNAQEIDCVDSMWSAG